MGLEFHTGDSDLSEGPAFNTYEKGVAHMLIPTTMVILLIGGMAYTMFPHWSSSLMAASVGILIYAAYRTWKTDQNRKRAFNRPAQHPMIIDNGYIRDSARASPLVGNETVDTGDRGD